MSIVGGALVHPPLILWRLGLEGSKKDDFQCALQMKEKIVGLIVNRNHRK
jgi:hypothetical protein